MICPHCATDLQRKQRSGHRCSRCRRQFAFDPKDNPLQLYDIRLRKLAEALSDPGLPGAAPLGYTADQLHFAAMRKVLAAGPSQGSGWLGCAVAVAVFGGVLIVGTLMADLPAVFVPAILIVAVVAGLLVATHGATAKRRRHPGLPISRPRFHALLTEWQRVYSAWPPGMLPPQPASVVWPPVPPRAVLFCTDPAIVTFLAAAGVPGRQAVVLVPPAEQWPPPELVAAVRQDPTRVVVVLHDADVAGCLTVPRLRAVLPPGTRVLDAGLAPRIGMIAGPPVRHPPDESASPALLAEGATVTAAERAWLAQGHAFPLAAVRPARLLRAVERTLSRADPEANRAAELGFLRWPARAR